jgi:chromosome segregation ATPase
VNILTKISIVVLVLLNILAGVVFSSQAVSVPNYRAEYEAQEKRAEQADLKARNADLLYSNAQIKNAKLEEQLARTEGEMGSQNRALQAELAEKNALIDQLEDDFEHYSLQLDELKELLNRTETERKLLDDRMNRTDANYDRKEAEYIAIQGELASAQAQIERDSGEKRVLREQIVHHEEEIERLTSTVIAMGGKIEEDDPTVYTTSKLTASITAVQADGLASINIGQIGGAREGMVMFIYRGSEFVGNLRIEEVDDNASAGVVFDVREGMSVRQGDRTTNKLD